MLAARSALATSAVPLQEVALQGEAALARHSAEPPFIGGLNLLHAPTVFTDKVMVMFGTPACPEDLRLPQWYRVHLTQLRQGVQMPVDRRQSDVVTCGLKPSVQVLG